MRFKASTIAMTGACCTLFWLLLSVVFAGLFGWGYASCDRDDALDMRSSYLADMRSSYLAIDNLFPVAFREERRGNFTNEISTRDDPAYAHEWSVLFRKFSHAQPCPTRSGKAVGEVWIAPGDACWLATNSNTSTVGERLRQSGICNNTVFADDYSLAAHFLVCLELTEYNYLRMSDHCYDEDQGLRITDERLRSVCFMSPLSSPPFTPVNVLTYAETQAFSNDHSCQVCNFCTTRESLGLCQMSSNITYNRVAYSGIWCQPHSKCHINHPCAEWKGQNQYKYDGSCGKAGNYNDPCAQYTFHDMELIEWVTCENDKS